mmetsp:Transcript_248/g.1981  ORF Transcript_248/g.1981 Transcript_248/m.1981 type:complete len:147 (+) Transcript_248:348-788(+)
MKTRNRVYEATEDDARLRGVQVYLRKVKRPNVEPKKKSGATKTSTATAHLTDVKDRKASETQTSTRGGSYSDCCESTGTAGTRSLPAGRFSRLFMGDVGSVSQLQAEADAYLNSAQEREVNEFCRRWGFDVRKDKPVHHPLYTWTI